MITVHLKYEIDPDRIEDFEEDGRRWVGLVNRFGGTHHGYFLPSEGDSDVAYALFSFPSLALYEQYRTDSMSDIESLLEWEVKEPATLQPTAWSIRDVPRGMPPSLPLRILFVGDLLNPAGRVRGDTAGVASDRMPDYPKTGVLVQGPRGDYVTAHEVGHILLGDGPEHGADRFNLMHEDADPQTDRSPLAAKLSPVREDSLGFFSTIVSR